MVGINPCFLSTNKHTKHLWKYPQKLKELKRFNRVSDYLCVCVCMRVYMFASVWHSDGWKHGWGFEDERLYLSGGRTERCMLGDEGELCGGWDKVPSRTQHSLKNTHTHLKQRDHCVCLTFCLASGVLWMTSNTLTQLPVIHLRAIYQCLDYMSDICGPTVEEFLWDAGVVI